MTAVLRPRVLLVVVLGLAALVLVAAVNMALGSARLGVLDVLSTVVGGGDRRTQGIVFGLRLPRTLAGALVGAALGLAGAIFQTVARNPLASPDILGITWGAGAGAVGVIVLAGNAGQLSGIAGSLGVPLAGLLGGLVAGALLYALSWRSGIDGFRMVLMGVGISAIGYNLVHWMLTVGDVDSAAQATTWLIGNLADVGWESVTPTALALVVLVPAVLLRARSVAALQYGDDTARGLGVRVDKERAVLLLLAAVLAAVATAAAGPITFVALAVPQIALRLAGTAHPPLAGSAVLGALLVVAADLAVRLIPGASDLPVGVLTAILGAPYLIFLFIRARQKTAA